MSDPPTVDEHLDKALASLDDLTVRELETTAEALEHRRDAWASFRASSATSPMPAGKAGARVFPAFTFGSTSPVPTRSWPAGSRMRRRRSGGMCATLAERRRNSVNDPHPDR